MLRLNSFLDLIHIVNLSTANTICTKICLKSLQVQITGYVLFLLYSFDVEYKYALCQINIFILHSFQNIYERITNSHFSFNFFFIQITNIKNTLFEEISYQEYKFDTENKNILGKGNNVIN